MSCRVHGRGCRVPWGWDETHTDSSRPYTLDELLIRTDPPHRYAYPSTEDYVKGWRLWRALRRDDRLTPAEMDAVWEVIEAHLINRSRQIRTS